VSSILLVDDDDQFRTMLSEVLTNAGYQVHQASDGLQAIKYFESQPTDLVITDLVMPNKEGLELILDFKRLYSEVKIIAISGGGRNGPQDYLEAATEFGAQRVFAKPFSTKEIIEAIRQLLEP
jgi:CheY-like chemotaxis protein